MLAEKQRRRGERRVSHPTLRVPARINTMIARVRTRGYFKMWWRHSVTPKCPSRSDGTTGFEMRSRREDSRPFNHKAGQPDVVPKVQPSSPNGKPNVSQGLAPHAPSSTRRDTQETYVMPTTYRSPCCCFCERCWLFTYFCGLRCHTWVPVVARHYRSRNRRTHFRLSNPAPTNAKLKEYNDGQEIKEIKQQAQQVATNG